MNQKVKHIKSYLTTGRVVGIYKDKHMSNIKLMLEDSNFNIEGGDENFALGEKVELEINLQLKKKNKQIK